MHIKRYHMIFESLDNIKNNPFYDELCAFMKKFTSSEQLLRSGGIPIDILDRLAHGFSESDIKQLEPDRLKIRWWDDIGNVKYEIRTSGLSEKEWAKTINLNEPIDVSYRVHNGEKGFFIEDGHHRYMAAKILDRPLNVDIDINLNPIKEIDPELSYDEFHRKIFDMVR